MEKKVGDGTGMKGGGSEHDGLTYRDDMPNTPGKPYLSHTQTAGVEKVDSRTTPPPKDSGKGTP